ncbi:MAG: DNA primase [Betaproteobacteria bacterium 13_1_40CM_4_64_4]|nr:MAG: DNA primase [Betaproteobacteria bacterium 13_1_40CM_4_64_4]
MIPNDFIQTLLARVDIVDVVDRYVPLKKAGANYTACCPFHSEKTPSFTVSPSKQFYHCFGCGAHGTAIGFLMEYGGKSFPDAVEELAQDAGLEVPRSVTPAEDARRAQGQDLTGLLLHAAKFYRTALKEASRAIDYLKDRGLTGPIAVRFGIGYAPDEWQPLARAFPDYQDQALETAGLVIAGEAGKRYDRFRDRIMFPIHDASGRVVGFGGRVLDKGEPKYLNSPETPLFSKGRELYGLFQARQAIRAAGKVVVVEGYMDVVALAQHGVEYAVATLGTATTATHVQKLFRLTDTVVFCFDGDEAGRRAAWRALENTLAWLADGKNAKFLFLPDGADPDDYVRRHGSAAFEGLVGHAVPLSDFLLSELVTRHPPSSAEDRAALVNAAKPLLSQLHAPILSTLLRRRIAEIAGLPEIELAALLPGNAPRNAPEAPARTPRAPVTSNDRRLLRALLFRPQLATGLDIELLGPANPERPAVAFIQAATSASPVELTTAALIEQARGTLFETLFDELAGEIFGWHDDYDVNAELTGLVEKLKRGQENAAFREIVRSGSVDELSPEQRKRAQEYRRGRGSGDARET